jgi:hypothetical protein
MYRVNALTRRAKLLSHHPRRTSSVGCRANPEALRDCKISAFNRVSWSSCVY